MSVLLAAVEEAEQLIRPKNDAYVDFFAWRYSYLRQFVPNWLEQLNFCFNQNPHPVLQAVDLLRELDRQKNRAVPSDAPVSFIASTWTPYAIDKDGTINRRYYELATLWALREALRSGNIWVANSRRYAEIESYLIPVNDWSQRRLEICELTGTPADGQERLAARRTELEQALEKVNRLLSRPNDELRIENGQVILTPLDAEEKPEGVDALSDLINERMPRVDITDVLIEVDSWVGFSKHFKHAGGGEIRSRGFLRYLYGCILAQACNFGLAQMAESSGIPHHQLLWCNIWYLREKTLRDACHAMVNYHFHLPLSWLWGDGVLSSSDGQRFPVTGKVRMAKALPRYYGYGQGVTFYTWSSNQLSQYGTKPASSTTRDSTYVLDEMMNNETELPILEHTTDTAGFTDVIFALFDLLGMRFSPRLRDISSLQLYRFADIDMDRFAKLKDQVRGLLDEAKILGRWDDMLRVSGSLQLGYVTASLFVQKLQSYPQKNALTLALQEYGRLLRTIHILRWYADKEERRRINRQLNKGESLHARRSAIIIANQGEIRRKQDEALTNQAGCLNLVTNAVVIWNTVYMNAVVEQLRKEGHVIRDDQLAHIWPTRHNNINFHGQYHFNVEEAQQRDGLRELRQPDPLAPLAPKNVPLL